MDGNRKAEISVVFPEFPSPEFPVPRTLPQKKKGPRGHAAHVVLVVLPAKCLAEPPPRDR